MDDCTIKDVYINNTELMKWEEIYIKEESLEEFKISQTSTNQNSLVSKPQSDHICTSKFNDNKYLKHENIELIGDIKEDIDVKEEPLEESIIIDKIVKKKSLLNDIIASYLDNPLFGELSDIEVLSDNEDLLDTPESITTKNFKGETVPIIDFEENDNIEIVGESPYTAHVGNVIKEKKKEDVKLIKSSFVLPPIEKWEEFHCGEEPKSPLQYFSQFINEEIIGEFQEKTNIYFFQKNGKNLGTTNNEIRQLLGIHIEMGSMGLPQLKLYWSKSRRFSFIANSMTFNRFCVLRNHLHIVNNLEQNPSSDDKFWKVRPLMDSFMEKIKLLEKEMRVCIDEQLIPFKGNLSLKQYIKGKPSPWGIKLFFLCGESGIPYNFIAYQGKSTKLPEEYSHLGIGGAVVVSLVEETLEPFEGFRVFFGNFFTSPMLVQHLADYGMYCTGSMRNNRIGKNVPLKSIKKIGKKNRGYVEGCVSEDYRMSLARWDDNSVVTILPSAYGWQDKDAKARRWHKSTREKVEVPCPSILQYNQSMGGVEKLDYLLALHRIHIKSKKWTLRVIFHFVDLAVVTSWLLYKRDCKISGIELKKQLTLLSFRMELAESLVYFGSNPLTVQTAGRPSISQVSLGNDSRYDGIGHFPKWIENRERCKIKSCVGKSYVTCIKCKVSLCLNKERNCFIEFHSK